MLRGVTTVVYHTDDFEAAIHWYGEVLGAEPYFLRPPWYAEFRIGDYQHELGILATGAEKAPDGVVTYWYVDDVEAAYRRLLDLGATEHEAPRKFGEGYVGGIVVDPFGNLLGVMHNVHYKDVLDRIPPFELPPVRPDVSPASG
jgi:predicted enzyme related to lactoylglutathione lyase